MGHDAEEQEGTGLELHISLVAAILTAALREEQARFLKKHGRLPDGAELHALRSGIIKDWRGMIEPIRSEIGGSMLRALRGSATSARFVTSKGKPELLKGGGRRTTAS